MLHGQFVRSALGFFTGSQPVGTRLCTAQQGAQLLDLVGLEQPTEGGEPVQSSQHSFYLAGYL